MPEIENGKLVGQYGTVKDISDLKRAEEQAKLGKETIELITENIAEVVYKSVYGQNNRYTIDYVSPNIKEILGVTAQQYEENDPKLIECLKESDLPRARDFNQQVKNATKPEAFTFEYEWFHPVRQEWIWLSETIVPEIGDNKVVGQFGTVEDITRKKEADKKTLKAIIQAEETERQRLAHDLHDGLGQRIAAANMSVSALSSFAHEQFDDEAMKIFNIAKRLIHEATVESRAVSHNIMPRSLKDFGLEQSIRDMVDNYQVLSLIHI